MLSEATVLLLECPVKERPLEGFGERLASLRNQRGLSQAELGKLVGVSKRVVTYYENESPQPPGALLVELARALRCSLDELMGLKAPPEKMPPKTARLRKRLQKVESLPAADQRTVLKLVEALHETHQRTAARPRARRQAS